MVADVERWPLYRCGHCSEVAITDLEMWPLLRRDRCREVAVVERWPL